MCLTAIPRGKVAQMLVSASSCEQGLNREARAVILRLRIRLECPKNNLRELR